MKPWSLWYHSQMSIFRVDFQGYTGKQHLWAAENNITVVWWIMNHRYQINTSLFLICESMNRCAAVQRHDTLQKKKKKQKKTQIQTLRSGEETYQNVARFLFYFSCICLHFECRLLVFSVIWGARIPTFLITQSCLFFTYLLMNEWMNNPVNFYNLCPQTRGSIPFYWSQRPNLKYKPKPQISKSVNHVRCFLYFSLFCLRVSDEKRCVHDGLIWFWTSGCVTL